MRDRDRKELCERESERYMRKMVKLSSGRKKYNRAIARTKYHKNVLIISKIVLFQLSYKVLKS